MAWLDHMVVLLFNSLRNVHIDFYSDWTNLLSHEKYKKVLFLPELLSTFVISFLDDTHSDWSKMESQCHFDFHFFDG
jgi:hypothetical protein